MLEKLGLEIIKEYTQALNMIKIFILHQCSIDFSKILKLDLLSKLLLYISLDQQLKDPLNVILKEKD